jgi:phosphoenolpyruvate carboxylase
MRKIPATMATQHPDNAGPAYWNGKVFINTLDEIEECYRMFHELKCTEYMWDWEGKFVDEAVVEKLFQNYHEFFKKKQLGKDVFLTFRIPNIDEESGFRLARAYMAILTADDMAHEVGLNAPPVFEVILPMTKTAKQLMHVKETFHEVEEFKRKAFRTRRKEQVNFQVIPLFEGVEHLIDSGKVLSEYVDAHTKKFGTKPPYLRPFMARSDPALNAGLIPAVLANKVALHHFYTLGEKEKIKIFPIIGPGCLPFRGGVNPQTIQETIKEYAGIRTITIQSAFRYDYPLEDVKKAIGFIEKTLPTLEFNRLSGATIKNIDSVIKTSATFYRKTVESIAPTINNVASHFPRRRERMQHVGLFGYSRGIGKVSLPRAIGFTGSLYSIGVPPEFIGLGRSLEAARKAGLLKTIEENYINLHADLIHAGKYLNKENLSALAKKDSGFAEIEKDVKLTESYLGKKLEPFKTRHFIHRNLVSSVKLICDEGGNPDDELQKAAILRKSLG